MINLKDISLHCIGYRGIDDEWYRDSRYMALLKIDKHHYQVKIWKRKKSNWGMQVHLCLTASNSTDILIIEKSAKTMKKLKQVAVDELNKYNNTYRCDYDIEKWKETHGKKVFDKDFNYLGISYTSPEREKANSEYDYYNDNKPKIENGTYYMLEAEYVKVCNIGYGWSSTNWDNSEELRKKFNSIN